VALIVLAAIPARALEERIILSPGRNAVRDAGPALPAGATRVAQRQEKALARGAASGGAFGDWIVDGAILRTGFRGAPEFALAHAAYKVEPETDLLLHFDSQGFKEEAGEWSVSPGSATLLDRERAQRGAGAASFRGPDSTLVLTPGPRALLARDSRFRDFSIEFWLFPANAENGEMILMWQSIRKAGANALPQQLSCVISSGRIAWSFFGFFVPPEAHLSGSGPFPESTQIDLVSKTPLIPRTWSHHLLRFDGDSGLVEYLVDGVPEAIAWATSSGREGGTVFEPAIGGASPLRLAADYSGLIDEFRISRAFVERPTLRPYGRDPALVVSPIADLGYTASHLLSISAEFKAPGTTGVEFAYRVADEAAGWNLEDPPWIPLRKDEALPASARGRYVQVRAELFPDGTGRLTPSLSSITLHYEPDPPPPPPARLLAVPKNGAIELRWSRVPVDDLGGYLVYYGDSPGEYFGNDAAEGPSPIDAGQSLSFVLNGLPNGRLVYIVIAAYDSAGLPTTGGTPTARAGDFSPEIAARPSRTAP
jgi:hypothetical protein